MRIGWNNAQRVPAALAIGNPRSRWPLWS